MLDPAVTEEPIYFGAGGRLTGILTQPRSLRDESRALPRFVFLNAGLLHRVGPNRLYTFLARELARAGFCSVRVDLSGKGDSPAREGLNRPQSVELDHEEIVGGLESRFGPVTVILAGLCSGADDAVRLAPIDDRVVGMLLLDPMCFPDAGFDRRTTILKYTNPASYAVWLRYRLSGRARPRPESEIDPLAIRVAPTLEQLRAAFVALCVRRGRVLSIFTGGAVRYYNQQGQLGRVLNVEGYERHCSELLWLGTEHTYTLDLHRRRLLKVVRNWAETAFIPGGAAASGQ